MEFNNLFNDICVLLKVGGGGGGGGYLAFLQSPFSKTLKIFPGSH